MMPSIPMKVRTVRFYAFSPEERAAAEKLRLRAEAIGTYAILAAMVVAVATGVVWCCALAVVFHAGIGILAVRKTRRVLESWRDVACDMDVPPFEERLVFMVTHGRRQESAKVSQLVN